MLFFAACFYTTPFCPSVWCGWWWWCWCCCCWWWSMLCSRLVRSCRFMMIFAHLGRTTVENNLFCPACYNVPQLNDCAAMICLFIPSFVDSISSYRRWCSFPAAIKQPIEDTRAVSLEHLGFKCSSTNMGRDYYIEECTNGRFKFRNGNQNILPRTTLQRWSFSNQYARCNKLLHKIVSNMFYF